MKENKIYVVEYVEGYNRSTDYYFISFSKEKADEARDKMARDIDGSFIQNLDGSWKNYFNDTIVTQERNLDELFNWEDDDDEDDELSEDFLINKEYNL